jgi:Pallilysin beta barrel domain
MAFALRAPAVLLAGLVLFSACSRESPPQGELKVAVSSAPLAAAAAAEDQQPTPKVPLESGESLASVMNCNLDLDTSEEQILVLRRGQEPDAPLRIAVADYDSVRGAYVRTWEGPTSATNLRLFEISLQDLVGDHNQEIVCRGVNGQGELVLDVFRKTPSPAGLGLYFTEICQIAADASIEIEQVYRPEGYRLGQKNGPSYPIHAYSRDRTSANLLDRIRYTYQWQYQQNRYVLTGEEELPGIVVQEAQLRELFSDPSVEHFEQYLAGPWLLSGSRGREEILLFDPQARQITIYSGQVEETYEWQTSFRSFSNRLYILAANESIASVRKRITVEVVALNSIDVSILGNEEWDRSGGRYLKLTEEMQNDLLAGRAAKGASPEPELQGAYRGSEGAEIIFDPPRFTWIEPARQYSGGFAVFRLDRDVLYLKGLDERGLPAGESAYLLEYAETKEGPVRVRRLTLTPAKLGVHGAEAVSEKKLVFEQREAESPP